MCNRLLPAVVLSLALSFVVAQPVPAAAPTPEVPPQLQAAIFKKVIAFDKTLKGVDPITVAVVDSKPMEGALEKVGFSVKSMSEGDLGGADGIHAVYGPKGEVGTIAAEKGWLSLSGDRSAVEAGKAAIGVGIQGGKPRIFIHLGQLKSEGHELSANVLKLANVIK